MARQKSIIKLEGTIGDITFLKTRDGYLAREKTTVSGERIATDAAFQRTRENMAEFGRAGKAGKVLRSAFRSQLLKASDTRMVSRLTREMMRVVQADAVNDRGQRNVIDGEALLLEGFDFNINGKLGSTLYAPFEASIDRQSGGVTVSIPGFAPAEALAAPAGTTHFKIFATAAEIDFEKGQTVQKSDETAILPWNSSVTNVLNLSAPLPAASTHPLFLAIGVEFLQAVNSNYYPLKNGAFNAMALVKVDTPA